MNEKQVTAMEERGFKKRNIYLLTPLICLLLLCACSAEKITYIGNRVEAPLNAQIYLHGQADFGRKAACTLSCEQTDWCKKYLENLPVTGVEYDAEYEGELFTLQFVYKDRKVEFYYTPQHLMVWVYTAAEDYEPNQKIAYQVAEEDSAYLKWLEEKLGQFIKEQNPALAETL